MKRTSFLVVVTGLCTLGMLCGCAEGPGRMFGRGAAPTAGRMSKEKLRDELDNFQEFFRNNTSQALIEIEQRQPTVRTNRTVLLLRTRANQALQSMLEHDDPIIAFIETWGLCVRTTQYFEEGHGSRFFGEHQHFIVEAIKRNEAEIERIGGLLLDDEMFAGTRRNIHAFAGANPIKDTYSNGVVYATQVRTGEPNPYVDVVTLPLAPFEALRGVDRTALAIDKFSNTAARFSDVVEGFPETSKWQMQLLLYDLEETEMAKSFLASVSQLSESSARLAETAENLPQEIRQQLSELIEEVDARQANIQATLQQAEKTAETFARTAEGANQAAQQWDAAAKSTALALQEFAKLKPPKKKTIEPAKPFDILEYRDTIEAAAKTANELRELAVEIRTLAEPDFIDATLGQTTKQARGLTNYIFWRAALLAVLVFALALVYRIIINRVTGTQSKGPSSNL
jgi:hypothetical protein